MQFPAFALLLPLATAVTGTVLYHLAARQAPAGANSAAVLLGAYVVGAILCVVSLVTGVQPGNQQAATVPPNWTSIALGIAVVLIEFGFLWMYRVGWPISSGALMVNISATLALALVGWLAFREQLSIVNWLGMLVCLIGLALLTQRGS